MPTGKGVIGDSRGTRFKIYIYNNIGMVSPCPEVYRFAMHKHYLIFNNVMYYVIILCIIGQAKIVTQVPTYSLHI